MSKSKKEEFISIPIYLDQKVIFDHMAIIENGYSDFTNIVETDSEGKKRSSIADASLGTSNALSFLGVSLGIKAGTVAEKEAKAQKQATKTKIHTPTSLFHIYRDYLIEQELLHVITEETDLASIEAGYFIEMSASLDENPITAFFSSIIEIMTSPIMKFINSPTYSEQTAQSKQQKSQTNTQNKEIITFSESIVGKKNNDLIANDINIDGLKVLLATQEKYFMEGWRKDIIDGEFTILGKVIKTITDSEESISLAQQGLFKFLPEESLQDFASSMANTSNGINLPELKTSLSSPAMKVYPNRDLCLKTMPTNNQIQFEDKLILQKWILKLLEVDGFSVLQAWLKDPDLEGFDDENISYFHHALVTHLANRNTYPKR